MKERLFKKKLECQTLFVHVAHELSNLVHMYHICMLHYRLRWTRLSLHVVLHVVMDNSKKK